MRSFRLTYDHPTRMMRVKHFTVADASVYRQRVKGMVIKQELIEEGMDPASREFEQAWLVRHKAWQKLVQGRTWTAVCADDWNMWPIEKIRANYLLSVLFNDEDYVDRSELESIDFFVDRSTLTLLRD